MRYLVVERVRPDGNLQGRNRHGTVVNVSEVFEDLILSVPSGLQKRSSHSNDIVFRYIGKVPEYFPHPDHFSDPFFVALILQIALQPENIRRDVIRFRRLRSRAVAQHSRDCLRANFVAFVRQLLDHVVIAVLVRDEERSPDFAAIRVSPPRWENFLVLFEIVLINRAIKCENYHLRSLQQRQ